MQRFEKARLAAAESLAELALGQEPGVARFAVLVRSRELGWRALEDLMLPNRFGSASQSATSRCPSVASVFDSGVSDSPRISSARATAGRSRSACQGLWRERPWNQVGRLKGEARTNAQITAGVEHEVGPAGHGQVLVVQCGQDLGRAPISGGRGTAVAASTGPAPTSTTRISKKYGLSARSTTTTASPSGTTPPAFGSQEIRWQAWGRCWRARWCRAQPGWPSVRGGESRADRDRPRRGSRSASNETRGTCCS